MKELKRKADRKIWLMLLPLFLSILFLPFCHHSSAPDLLCYDLEYLTGYYYWSRQEVPTKIGDIIVAYEELQQEWPNNPHEATYHYLCEHQKLLFLFVNKDKCYYLDLYNLGFCVIYE